MAGRPEKADNPKRLFRYGGNPCRIERDNRGSPVTRTLNQDRMRSVGPVR